MNWETVKPEYKLSDLVYPEEIGSAIDGLLEDFKYEKALFEHGLLPRKKILVHGPSGCGKTSLAHALAHELKLPLCLLSISKTLGSHLGETGKAVAEALQYAGLNRCLLFLDEFDAIGSTRTAISGVASKEMNASANTLLVELERAKPLGIIMACTNFYTNLDSAIIRRFNFVLEMPSPTADMLRAIAENIIQDRFGIDVDEILQCAATPAGVVQESINRLRRAIINLEKAKPAPVPIDGPTEAKKIRKKLQSASGPLFEAAAL